MAGLKGIALIIFCAVVDAKGMQKDIKPYQLQSLFNIVLAYCVNNEHIRKLCFEDAYVPEDIRNKVHEGIINKLKRKVYPVTLNSISQRNLQSHGVVGVQGINESNQIVSIGANGRIIFCCGDSLADCPVYFDESRLTCLCLQDNAHQVIVGKMDGKISVWNYSNYKKVREISAHLTSVTALVLSFNQLFLASSSGHKLIKVWNTSAMNMSECLLFDGHTAAIRGITFLDDKTLVSGSLDDTLCIWDIENKKRLLSYPISGLSCESSDKISCLKALPTLSSVACGLDKGGIYLWDPRSKNVHCKMNTTKKAEHTWEVSCLCADYLNDAYLLSGSLDGTIKIWDIRLLSCAATLQGNKDQVLSVSTLYNGEKIISGSRDGVVGIWDARKLVSLGKLSIKKALTEIKEAESSADLDSPGRRELLNQLCNKRKAF